MNAADFSQLRAAFHAVIELAPAQRAVQLAGLAAADPPLYEAVLGLLESFREQDLQTPAAQVSAAQIVGPYRLLQPLGSGGMGEVFLAERVDGGFDQQVALKLVRSGALSATLTRRFLRERQILARLEHAHIARLLDGGFSADGRPWLAMEYVAGSNILRHAQQQRLGLRARVALLAQVAGAVAYAQRNLVVHRDIKPANVLVDADGEPRLLDFGIAKLLVEDGPAEHTRTAWRAMTTRYAAPEQIAGEPSTTATDVYSLGVLLFELVAEASPYRETDSGARDWSAAVLRQPPRSLAEACTAVYTPRERRRLQGGLERIVQKALCKPPAQRYAGAAALAEDLQDWLDERPLRSGIGGAREQTRQLLLRYRWPITVALASLLALGGGALLAWREARQAAEQARLARANLDALLNLLGAASPRHYAGRDPPASEFLLRAAAELQARHGDDAALLQRALSEIGHGLVNLGKPRQAEPVLRAAVAALERDTSATTAGRLASYRLLAAVQDRPEDAAALRATAARIAELAARSDVEASQAVEALGAAAGALSRLGEFTAAEGLFAQGDRLLAITAPPAGSGENFWRQRGWSALRAFDLKRAQQCFTQARAAIAARPADFSPMRRAEGELLLAEAALAGGDAAAAAPHLAAAEPIYAGEYPPGHPERAVLALHQARLHLLRGELDAAQSRLDAAQAGLAAASAHDRLLHGLARAELAAARRQCDQARGQLDAALLLLEQLQPVLPREEALARAAGQRIGVACGVEEGKAGNRD